jgi:organic radical activating enzyme
MKKTLILIALTISTAFFATSCSNDDEVAPSGVEGTWKLESYQSEIKFADEDAEKENVNTSSENLTITFASNGTFTSNSLFSIDEIVTEETKPVTGTYELKDGYLIMKYKDSDNENVIFYLKVKSSNSSDLVLTFDKEALSKIAKDTAKSDPETAATIEFLILLVDKLNITFNYKKA